jgi:hypothetical protein
MASKKKQAPSAQLGLGALMSTQPPASAPMNPNHLPEGAAVDMRAPVPSPPATPPTTPSDVDLESFDDYDDAASVNGIPRLRLVDPPRDAPTVIVEAVGDKFEVCRLRDNGTTSACVIWTRKELEELQRRIAAALEM